MKREDNGSEANPKENFFIKNKKSVMILSIVVVVTAAVLGAIFLWPGMGDKPEPAAGKDPSSATQPGSSTGVNAGKEQEPGKDIGYELKKPFDLIPEDSDETGTSTDSGYRILLDQYEYTAKELLSHITISPQTEFTIKENAKNDFLLQPASVRPNQIYSVNFADEEEGISYSWAFQTRKEFFVTGTLPRDMATYVPINTGIEVSFSHKVENDLSAFFEISPKVQGRFEIHKSIVSFVPLNSLDYDTIYTVTVREGFPCKTEGLALQKDTVFAFQTEPKPENRSDGYDCESFQFARRIYNLYPYETPLLSVHTNINSNEEVEFYLYRYDDQDQFRQDIEVKDDRPYWCVQYDQPINYEGKEQILSMNTVFLSDAQDEDKYYYRTKFIQLPQNLPEGHYVAVIKKDKMERKAYIQINELAVYVGTADNKTLGWVHHSESAAPAPDVEICFDNFTMVTGQEGLAVSDHTLFDEASSRVKNYTVRREGHPDYYATIGDSYYSARYYYDYDYYYQGSSDNFQIGAIQDQYWGYLFTDRDMYMPDDTINIWGMVAEKDNNTTPGSVNVVLSKGYSSYYSSSEYAVIDEKEAGLSGTQTFKTSLSFENLCEGYYTLGVFSGETLLLSKHININKYVKPIYTLSTTMSEQNVVYGDKVEFTLETSFFEGTPVNGMNFQYHIGGLSMQENSGTLRTDENGRANLELTAICDTDSWRPHGASVSVSNADPEETSVNAYGRFTLFPRDTMLQVKSKTDNSKKCVVDMTTQKINIDGIRDKEWYTLEDYTGDPTDVEINVELFETWYTATKTGTYYNFITKKTHDIYQYDHHERKIQELKVNTVNGEGTFEFDKQENKGYYAVFRCVDGNGRPIRQKENFYNAYYDDNSESWYQAPYYHLEANQENYAVDEEAEVTLYRDKEPVTEEEDKKVLFMLYRKGLIDYTITGETVYSVIFGENFIPNAGVMAVYFDGKNFINTSMKTLTFNQEERKLNISVTPSKQQYRPGDTATFDCIVTDPAGKGRKTEVLFSIVDEAYFALRNQSVNLLSSIYGQYVSIGYNGGSIPHTNTLEDFNYYGGAECGEGGDEMSGADIRSDFRDTALFESVITDEAGHGQISLKLPDNLTKWRVTYLGLTDDLYADSGTINVDVRLPFFINTVFHDVFITGDEPVLQLRSFGTEIKEGERVEYIVEVEKDGKTWQSGSTDAPAGQRALMQLNPLEEGTYTYTVTGRQGQLQDAIRLTFEVLPGFVEQSRTDYQTLSENWVFPETKWPSRVYFFNENVREYFSELLEMAYSGSDRIDSIIVRKQAAEVLREYFKDTWVRQSTEYDTQKYQLNNGGIALLPYDSANPVLTAKICALNDSSFDYDQMKTYFYQTLISEEATSTDVAASYWGLACLKEPVLLELNSLLKSPDLTLIDRLYIALAYASLGDLSTAEQLYGDIIQKHMEEDVLRAYITILEEGYDSDDIQEATSLCALLAQKVNGAERDKLFRFVSNMYTTDILTNAMRLTYVKSNLKNVSMESSFTWELDGKKESVTIKGRETVSMFLTAEKLKSIRFSDVKGKITVSTIYTAPLGEISETDDRITIERAWYDRNGEEKTVFNPSEYVKVRLTISFDPTAPTGCYMVEDYLPASLRYVYGFREAEKWVRSGINRWYPHEISGQKVSFYIYHNNKDTGSKTIEYYARTYNLGEYTADHAAVFNLDSNIINYTPRARITVE